VQLPWYTYFPGLQFSTGGGLGYAVHPVLEVPLHALLT
jgi:hypothetical protein